MKILIAVPTHEHVEIETLRSIYNLDKCGHQCDLQIVRGYDCHTARNNIGKMALEKGYDGVLMVDSDVVLAEDTLHLMLDNPVDVCLGPYASKLHIPYDGATCICRLNKADGTEYFNYESESQYTGAEIADMANQGLTKVQIHGGGFGCALVNTAVLKSLEYPWFFWIEYPDGHGVLSEDLFFCERCKDAKIPVYTDVRLKLGHVFRYIQGI